MFNLFKNIFFKEEIKPEEITLLNLGFWFSQKVSQLNYDAYFQGYFRQIKEIKENFSSRIKKLREAEIPQEHRKMEERVKNIVQGHRDNYARVIEHFLDNLTVLEKEKFSTLEDYNEAFQFNQELDQKLGELAKGTAKSYQAAQHLFFDQVEAVFKSTGELNFLMKNFKKKIKEESLQELEETRRLILQLKEEREKENHFEKEIKEKERLSENKNKELEDKEKEFRGLKESQDYKDLLKLKMKKENAEKEIKNNEDKVFSFFSRLNKPLKKYRRAVLDDKLIKRYLEDSAVTFFDDDELKIKEVLQELKKNLDSLQFEDRQKKSFLELIKKSEEGYLEELFSVGKRLKENKEELEKEINESKIIKYAKAKEKEIDDLKADIENRKAEFTDKKKKLEKINLEAIQKEIEEKIKEVLNTEIVVKI